jgi:hypothetical protein
VGASPVAEAEERRRRKAKSQRRHEAQEMAEANFTLVNAVRVAGPDRILFWSLVLGPWSSVVDCTDFACLLLMKSSALRFFRVLCRSFAVNKSAVPIRYDLR